MPSTEPDEPLLAALRTPAFAQSAEPKRDVLSGPLGLRAGWGILFFFLFTFVFVFLLFIGLFKATGHYAEYQRDNHQARQAAVAAKAAHQSPPAIQAKPSLTLLSETSQVGAVLLAAILLSFAEKRRFGVYGLGTWHILDALSGAAWGLALLGLLVGLLRALHLLVFDRRLLYGTAELKYGAIWLLTFALVGVFEEFLFRGYIQFTLMRGLLGLGRRIAPDHAQAAAFWLAALLWSLLFSATHLGNAGEDPVGIGMVFLAGLVFSYALWRTGSLWWGVGFHMTWDWSQSFLYGVPDSGMLSAGRLFATHPSGNPLLSGGHAGPEGSVYVLPVLLLAALAIRIQPKRELPPVEPLALPLAPRNAGEGTIS